MQSEKNTQLERLGWTRLLPQFSSASEAGVEPTPKEAPSGADTETVSLRREIWEEICAAVYAAHAEVAGNVSARKVKEPPTCLS